MGCKNSKKSIKFCYADNIKVYEKCTDIPYEDSKVLYTPINGYKVIWKDELIWCPSQCYGYIPDKKDEIYLRWRWDDPWTMDLIRGVKESEKYWTTCHQHKENKVIPPKKLYRKWIHDFDELKDVGMNFKDVEIERQRMAAMEIYDRFYA